MNYSSYRITLDNYATSSQVVLNAKQGDTGRKIYISLTDGSLPYEIEDGCRAVFTAEKPDENLIYNDCEIDGDVIIYTITKQTTAAVGFVACEIKLYDQNDELLISPRFGLLVEESVFNDQDISGSGHEFNAVADIIIHTTNKYLEEHPVATDDTLTQMGMAADAQATGKAIEKANSAAAAAIAAATSAGDAAQAAANAASSAQGTANNALAKSGGTMTGEINMGGNQISNVKAPVNETDAANMKYVNSYVDDKMPTLEELTNSVLEKFDQWKGGSY